jgi:glycosyltransferase involved in cell wall biosynthesis
MKVSVVIPTRNRKESLFRLLNCLLRSSYPVLEVIIVDSSDRKLLATELQLFSSLNINYVASTPSVCIQRNIGIRLAKGDWIFICDDDLEVPSEYVQLITNHAQSYPEAGAISGVILQKENSEWTGEYPVISASSLLWRFIFQLSIWGEIRPERNNFLTSRIVAHYKRRGNHLSKGGWPVITNFSGDFFKTPLYGLGASIIKKEWLLNSLYDEVLDARGIGDNYGVAAGFPDEGIHVIKTASVYHHRENENRLADSLQYFRRALALDYFFSVKTSVRKLNHGFFLWSLFGNWMGFIFTRNRHMARAARKAFWISMTRKNPYLLGARSSKKVVEPLYD